MRCRKYNRTVKSNFLLNFFCKVSYNRSRHGNRFENLPVKPKQIDQFVIPVFCLRTYKLGRCRIGVFHLLDSGQQKLEVIRDHQHGFCLFQLLLIIFLYRHQLIDRVENLFLDSGSCIQSSQRNLFIHLFIHSICTAVSVTCCIPQNLVIFIQQYIVYRPGIDRHGYRNFPQLFTYFQSVFDFCKQTLYIPAESPVFFCHSIRETVYLFQLHFPVFHTCQHMTATGCANVNSQIIFIHFLPPFRTLFNSII